MRTRRQTKLQEEQDDKKSPNPKKRPLRGQKKQAEPVDKDVKRPSKRVKKQKQIETSPESEPAKTTRGQKKKAQRVTQNSKPKEDSETKRQSKDNKSDSHAKLDKKSQAKQKVKKQEAKQQKKKSSPKPKRSVSPSPQKAKQKAKTDKSPQKDEIKKVIVKGAAPVDQYFDKGKDYHVLVHNTKVYSATLNQTNISNNNNKYYNLQVLQHDKDPQKNYFMTRWGRVGTPGQKSIEGPFTINVAINKYETKYREKHLKGEYREIELNYADDEAEDNPNSQTNENENSMNPMSDYQQSKLPKPTKDLIKLIFDIGMMNRQMKQIGYNVNKMPLGKLSSDNIKKGYNILKQLEDEIEHKKRQDEMERLTNDFYSYIPHDVGFRNMRLYKLDSLKKVKQKLQMLQSLAQIKIATEILDRKSDGNVIDGNYKKLNRDIKPVEPDSFTFKIINDYLQTTHASTHRSYDLELVDLFEVESDSEKSRFTHHIPNKMLLWHGSRLTNFVGILSQGLRIAPPEAPVTGYMFGKGVYFADMSSKSANYCFTSPQNNTGILILCEVAIGTPNQKMHADYLASNLPDGKHSTKGVGKTAPKAQNFQILDGAIVPMGPGLQSDAVGSSLLYNQFIVYDIKQIKIKYLLRVLFHYRKHN